MPNYKYVCKKCNFEFENMTTISKRKESICPQCGNTDNHQLIGTGGGGFRLLGDGFYESTKKDAENYKPME